jgi:predicted aspartyl protease
MKAFAFDPKESLIYVQGRISSSYRSSKVRLALDTGATETLIKPGVLARIGYDERNAYRTTVIHSAIGSERGYLVRVARFSALGCTAANFPIHAHELPGHYALDGLLGLSFLRHLNYAVRSGEGQLLVEPLAA